MVSTSELIQAPHAQHMYGIVYVSVFMKNERSEKNLLWSCEILQAQSPDPLACENVCAYLIGEEKEAEEIWIRKWMREQVKNIDIVRVWFDALVSVSWKLCSPIIAAFTSTLIFCALCDFARVANHLHIFGTNRLRIFVCANKCLLVGTHRATFHACTFDWLIGFFSIVEKSNFFLWSPLCLGCRLGCAHCKHTILILKEVRKRSFSLAGARQWNAGKGREKKEEKQLKTRGDLHGDIAHFVPPSLQLFSFVLSLHHIWAELYA